MTHPNEFNRLMKRCKNSNIELCSNSVLCSMKQQLPHPYYILFIFSFSLIFSSYEEECYRGNAKAGQETETWQTLPRALSLSSSKASAYSGLRANFSLHQTVCHPAGVTESSSNILDLVLTNVP